MTYTSSNSANVRSTASQRGNRSIFDVKVTEVIPDEIEVKHYRARNTQSDKDKTTSSRRYISFEVSVSLSF